MGLDYSDIESFALETNRDHSVIFEIASKYCISDCFVDHNGYSISSKGFLPTVVGKFGKLSSGHRTGKGQFSFQSQRKAMPKNARTTTQLHSSHMLVK